VGVKEATQAQRSIETQEQAMNKTTNIAVILAGGSGQRFGTALPKQFLPLAGKTVIEHSIDAFEECAAIDEIAVVMNTDYLPQMQSIIDRNSWKRCASSCPAVRNATSPHSPPSTPTGTVPISTSSSTMLPVLP
jgi:hypothetical protein